MREIAQVSSPAGRRLSIVDDQSPKNKGAMTTDPCGFWAGKLSGLQSEETKTADSRCIPSASLVLSQDDGDIKRIDLGLTSFRKTPLRFLLRRARRTSKVPGTCNYLSPVSAPAALGHGKQRAIPNPQKSGCHSRSLFGFVHALSAACRDGAE